MHYANGRAAKLGDIVRGKGYNVKHEITGRLISAQPENTSCNCTVAYVGIDSVVNFDHYIGSDGKWAASSSVRVLASFEYGQLDGFVAIDPRTGDVLPPE